MVLHFRVVYQVPGLENLAAKCKVMRDHDVDCLLQGILRRTPEFEVSAAAVCRVVPSDQGAQFFQFCRPTMRSPWNGKPDKCVRPRSRRGRFVTVTTSRVWTKACVLYFSLSQLPISEGFGRPLLGWQATRRHPTSPQVNCLKGTSRTAAVRSTTGAAFSPSRTVHSSRFDPANHRYPALRKLVVPFRATIR